MESDQLIHRYLIGEATAEEVAALDGLLAADPELRRKLIFEAGTDARLREIALERVADESAEKMAPVKVSFLSPVSLLSIAAGVVAFLGAYLWTASLKPEVVATLVSSEGASWESSLPTLPGSKLTAGSLNLTSGMATIRFRSGAEVVLEAPANLVLETPMRGKLLAGAAVIDVPDEAIGFIMETPDSYAVDHGTRFAVSVDEKESHSAFEVLEGEISVHHPVTGEEVRLSGRQSSTVSGDGMVKIDGPLPEKTLASTKGRVRIDASPGAFSVVGNNEVEYLHSDFLMAKKSLPNEAFDRRSLFTFDLTGFDPDRYASAGILLNLVPTGIGYAAHLPVVNRFQIYGRAGEAGPVDGSLPRWETVAKPEECELLGTFEIPRSQKRGTFGIETPELMAFLKAHPTGRVSFLLVRETLELERGGLVHTFASDSHPASSGPVLEFYQKPKSDHDTE
ncbi:MAG: FecR domain-containing protein [Verrucomicrobiales bacterium]|nr:FecR domain-containing protein [Verrucomicrobiales bacterium]